MFEYIAECKLGFKTSILYKLVIADNKREAEESFRRLYPEYTLFGIRLKKEHRGDLMFDPNDLSLKVLIVKRDILRGIEFQLNAESDLYRTILHDENSYSYEEVQKQQEIVFYWANFLIWAKEWLFE